MKWNWITSDGIKSDYKYFIGLVDENREGVICHQAEWPIKPKNMDIIVSAPETRQQRDALRAELRALVDAFYRYGVGEERVDKYQPLVHRAQAVLQRMEE